MLCKYYRRHLWYFTRSKALRNIAEPSTIDIFKTFSSVQASPRGLLVPIKMLVDIGSSLSLALARIVPKNAILENTILVGKTNTYSLFNGYIHIPELQ